MRTVLHINETGSLNRLTTTPKLAGMYAITDDIVVACMVKTADQAKHHLKITEHEWILSASRHWTEKQKQATARNTETELRRRAEGPVSPTSLTHEIVLFLT